MKANTASKDRVRRPLYNLYLAIALIVITGFLSLLALMQQWYPVAMALLTTCWLIDKKLYVCPFCASKLSPRAKLNASTICGNCRHSLYTGDVVKVENGRMNIKKKDAHKYC